MEAALVTVVLLSLAVALAMTLVTWRLVREERRRSAARVAVLMAERSPGTDSDDVILAPDWRHESVAAGPEADVASPGASTRLQPDPAPRPVFPPASDAPEEAAPPDLFAPPHPAPDGQRRLAVIAAALLVAAGVGLAWLASGGRAVEPSGAAAAGVVPLELLTLTQSRSGDTMAIRGSVRNPDGGDALHQVSAVALLFDRHGALLGSGHALLDFTTLAPGEESPFVISAPAARAVGRYRISFRREDNSIMPHVDRRQSPPRPQGLLAGGETEGIR